MTSATDGTATGPKAELHCHLDGAVRVATARELARSVGLDPDAVAARMVVPPACRSQRRYIECYGPVVEVLRSVAALERVAYELVVDSAADGVDYLEARWAPALYVRPGLGIADVIAAVVRGLRSGPIEAVAIVCAMRDAAPADNVTLARVAASFAGEGVVGFDLAGDELGYSALPHAEAFAVARAGGLGLTCHGGEVGRVDRVDEVLSLGIRRIGHGVAAARSPGLVDRLRREDVVLEMCPSANVLCGAVDRLDHHPLPALLRAGVACTISTDSRTIVGTTLTREFQLVQERLGLEEKELRACDAHARRAAFALPASLRG